MCCCMNKEEEGPNGQFRYLNYTSYNWQFHLIDPRYGCANN